MTVGKTLRFEVLKRDKFTCQYCGAKAPDVLLHADHIHPESKGGLATMLNLVTSCESCNLGKGDRLLADDAAVTKQQTQMAALAARREQMEMLLEWRAELASIEEDLTAALADQMTAATGLAASAADLAVFKRLLRRFPFLEVAAAIDDGADQYIKANPAPDEAVSRLMRALPRICSARQSADYEVVRAAAYAFGIVRNRMGRNAWESKEPIEDALRRGVSVATVNHICRTGEDVWHVNQMLRKANP